MKVAKSLCVLQKVHGKGILKKKILYVVKLRLEWI